MYKKTITYEDFDGNKRTEELYFNLTEAEMVQMISEPEGGLENYIRKISQAQNAGQQIELFRNLLEKSYGEKSGDGRRFIKTPEVLAAFTQTQAYSDMFMELGSDPNAAVEFLMGVIPKEFATKFRETDEYRNVTAELNAPKA